MYSWMPTLNGGIVRNLEKPARFGAVVKFFVCLIRFASVVLFLLGASACTINVYHAESALTPQIDSKNSTTPCSKICGGDNIRQVNAGENTETSVLEMNAEKAPGDSTYAVGDSVVLRVRPSVDAYVHCYYQMANRDIIKIFPNAQSIKSWMYSGQLIAIPERAAFRIVPDTPASSESFLCLAAAEDLSGKLPLSIQESMLKPLPVYSFDEIYRIYRDSTAGNLAGRVVSVTIL